MGEKILNKLKELWGKIIEWWAKFTAKQKTTIIILGVGVVVAFIILISVLTAPNYVNLKQCDSTKEASQVVDILKNADISYKVTDDGLLVKVPKKNVSTARLALGASGITATAYTIDQALSGSFTTTEADKQKKYRLFLESQLQNDFLMSFEPIKGATVNIDYPENDGTLLSKDEEPGAAIRLDVDDSFTPENAAHIAKAVATILGCSNTDNIVIMDTDANLLFSGEDDSTVAGSATTQLGVKVEAEKSFASKVKSVLVGTGAFGDIKVSANIVMDFSSVQKTNHDYLPAEGQSQGVLSEEKGYNSESSGGVSGVPGTDSNSETTHQIQDNQYSNSTIEEFYRKYLPNERIEAIDIPPGVVRYDESSIAISSTKYNVVKQDDVKKQGLLAGITWEEYQNANSQRTAVEVTDEMLELAANASGVPKNKISIVAYEENFFVDSEGLGIDIYDVVQIALIVIILVLLVVVVLKSMHTEKSHEEAEELSVETLLQSNPEPVLDDIELEETSETKKLIEKFVDENPEAAANLLRNWLNEEWG